MRIGHYETNVQAQGGTATYIRRLGHAQRQRGHEVTYLSQEPLQSPFDGDHVQVADEHALFDQAQRLDLDVLHLHQPVSYLPDDRVLTVRTMHNHSGSCVSGSRLLGRTGMPCDRRVNALGCLWGHYADRCGPRDPRRVWTNFQNVSHEVQQSKTLHTFAVSGFLREQMIETGHDPSQVHVIHSPAPQPKGDFVPIPRGTPPRFLFVGRLAPQKGADWLLRAIARLETPYHLDIAGDGPSLSALQQRVRSLDIENNVTFHGWCNSSRIETLFQQARAVVVPSIWHEPAGLVTLEAAAAGRPVIASRVGGIPEYADSSFARLVAPNDVPALADALTRLATDLELATQMGQAGLRAAETTFTMDAFIRRMDTLYEQAKQDFSPQSTTAVPS